MFNIKRQDETTVPRGRWLSDKTTKKWTEVMATSQGVVTLGEKEGVDVGMGHMGKSWCSLQFSFLTWESGYRATCLVPIHLALCLICVFLCFPSPSLPRKACLLP